SLGCTLYYLLAGQAPFPTGTLTQKIMAHAEREPRPLRQLRSDLPLGLIRVIEKMMTKDPARRYQKPAEVAAALAPFTAGDPDVAGSNIQCTTCSPDGRFYGAGGDGGAVRVWDVATGEQRQEFSGMGYIQQATFTPDGKQVLCASLNKTSILFEAATGQ